MTNMLYDKYDLPLERAHGMLEPVNLDVEAADARLQSQPVDIDMCHGWRRRQQHDSLPLALTPHGFGDLILDVALTVEFLEF